jgi:predicted phosphodiesterase
MKKIDIIIEYIIKYPTISKLSLAKLIYSKHPLIWDSAEAVRSSIRNLSHSSRYDKSKKEIGTNIDKLRIENMELIKGKRSKRKPYTLPKSQRKVLIISDLHVPYHSEDALEIALNEGKKQKCDTVLINGDFMDYYENSRFQIDPRESNLPLAIEAGKNVFKYIKKKFPKALIIFKSGNHDRRLEDKLINKAPELLGLNFWQSEKVLELPKETVMVADLDFIQLGKLKVLHGHEYKGGFIAPVNPARGLFLRTKESCLQSHVHRTSEHSEKTIGGKIISTWSIGCLSDLQPDYNPYNQYNHGFAIVDVETNGDFEVSNRKIINNKIM